MNTFAEMQRPQGEGWQEWIILIPFPEEWGPSDPKMWCGEHRAAGGGSRWRGLAVVPSQRLPFARESRRSEAAPLPGCHAGKDGGDPSPDPTKCQEPGEEKEEATECQRQKRGCFPSAFLRHLISLGSEFCLLVQGWVLEPGLVPAHSGSPPKRCGDSGLQGL